MSKLLLVKSTKTSTFIEVTSQVIEASKRRKALGNVNSLLTRIKVIHPDNWCAVCIIISIELLKFTGKSQQFIFTYAYAFILITLLIDTIQYIL